MYTLIISTALAIYTLVLVDVSILYKELSVSNDLLSATQALYTAEGGIEKTIADLGENHPSTSNQRFLAENQNREKQGASNFLSYQQGAESFYNRRKMNVSDSFLHTAQKTSPLQGAPVLEARINEDEKELWSENVFYGVEAEPSRTFVIREVEIENNFNEIEFKWDQNSQHSEIAFEVIIFPKENTMIQLPNFEDLKNNPEKNPFKRIIINSADQSSSSFAFNTDIPLTTQFDSSKNNKKSLRIAGFNPLENNYIFHFQTLDNQPIHYQLNALNQGKAVILPNLMQNIDLIGGTVNGVYQRLKYQRQTEEGLAPGLNFVHFSDESIIK